MQLSSCTDILTYYFVTKEIERVSEKRTFKLVSLPGILYLFGVLLVACGSNGGTGGSTTSIPAAPDKQVLRAPEEGGDFDTLDPALTVSGLGDPYNLIYGGLVALKDDGSVTTQLAASYQVSDDHLTYTFTLKPNLKFSDGTSLTADDVAYSLNRVVLPATRSSVSGYLGLLKDFAKVSAGTLPTLIGDSIIVKDPNTISLILSKPAAYFLGALAYSTGDVVEKKLIDKYADKWTDHLQEGGGDGPFKVANYGHTTNLTLVPNPNFYGFKPKIQKIIFTIASDRDSNYKAFKAGQYDLAPVPPALQPEAAKKSGFQDVPALASRFIEMNYLVKPLDNIKIRQALALAINKDLIVNSILGPNVVTPSNHIVPKGMPGYNENLTGPAGVTGTKGDQAKAKQLFQEGLQEAGYSSVSQLPTLTISYPLGYKGAADTITSITSEWASVLGWTIKPVGLQSIDLSKQEAQTIGSKGPLQLWYGDWGADYPDPQDWLSNFFGKGADENYANYGQNNSAAAADQQAVQADLAKADGLTDLAERVKIYNDAEQKIINDVGWITVYQSSYAYAVNPKLQGWKLDALGVMATEDWANIYFAQ
jgi:ABC-type transport system substrate-binding protein